MQPLIQSIIQLNCFFFHIAHAKNCWEENELEFEEFKIDEWRI